MKLGDPESYTEQRGDRKKKKDKKKREEDQSSMRDGKFFNFLKNFVLKTYDFTCYIDVC